MIEIEYAPSFLKQLKKCEKRLQEEATEKIKLFRDRANHKMLEVHKLKGKLAGKYGFSVNYRDRVVFKWLADNTAGLLAIGDHSVYD